MARTSEELHDYQHELIAERVQAFLQHPRRSGQDKRLRREAGKKAAWTLQGHLSGLHGFRHAFGPPLTLEALHAIHQQKHTDKENEMTPTTTAEARSAWRAEAETKITVEPESTGAAVRVEGMLVARFAALAALMTQSMALAHAETLAGELRLGYVALAAGEPDRSIGDRHEVLFVDTDNRRMTLDMLVRQSAAIHPDWSVNTHVEFLLNEHDRIAPASMVARIMLDHGITAGSR